jgi:serine O-acetyltransferase
MSPNEFFFHSLLSRHQAHCVKRLDRELMKSFLMDSMGLMFPQFQRYRIDTHMDLVGQAASLKQSLEKIITSSGVEAEGQAIGDAYINYLPKLLESLKLDAEAMFLGDPAAKSVDEVIICYPGFAAIGIYRIANFLHSLNLPIIPRAISEFAHERTGIDIHPGATIGKSFCIDHGTGTVIGETTIIGDNVKIYHGVTLGALSVDKTFSDTKRHPTIESNVIIYSGTTILGGETVIGENSIIGGNAWLTRSVRANSRVYHRDRTVVKE